MSLPSITETKNATLLRIRIVILAAHYTATSSHFCNSRPEAGGRHPQLTARPTAPDLFKGQVPRHPNTISYAILLMDPVLHITLTMLPRYCFCVHAGNLNFLIFQLLHHGVPGVDGCHPQTYRKAYGGRLRAAATAPSTCQVPIVHTGSLLYVYHSAEER